MSFRKGGRLQGKVAVGTGGSRGIGRGVTLEMTAEVASVVVNYRADTAAAEATVKDALALGVKATAIQGDVAREGDVQNSVQAALDEFDAIDILVCNAGTATFHPFLEIPLEEWDRTYAVNLRGNFMCAQAAARIMGDQKIPGSIIAISSITARVGGFGLGGYAPSRAGQEALIRNMAVGLGEYRITCNSIAPGTIRTDMNREDLSDPARIDFMEQRTSLKYLGDPPDIGHTAVFLASDEAAYITGETILVDGGAFVNFQ